MKIIIIAATLFILQGCQSEVDKCVDAFIDAADPAIKKSKEINDLKLQWRLYCMDMAKKNN